MCTYICVSYFIILVKIQNEISFVGRGTEHLQPRILKKKERKIFLLSLSQRKKGGKEMAEPWGAAYLYCWEVLK